jgi:hypothetical protein
MDSLAEEQTRDFRNFYLNSGFTELSICAVWIGDSCVLVVFVPLDADDEDVLINNKPVGDTRKCLIYSALDIQFFFKLRKFEFGFVIRCGGQYQEYHLLIYKCMCSGLFTAARKLTKTMRRRCFTKLLVGERCRALEVQMR